MSRRYCIAWFVISLPAGKRITILPWKTDSCHFFPRLKFDLYIWKKSVSRYLCNTHSATCCLNKKADFEVDFDDEWTCPLKAKQSMAVMEININLIVQAAKIRFFCDYQLFLFYLLIQRYGKCVAHLELFFFSLFWLIDFNSEFILK